jgi:hypothetical protein
VVDSEGPLHPDFTAGILKPPAGARAYSTAGLLGGLLPSPAVQALHRPASRHTALLCKGFAASCVVL